MRDLLAAVGDLPKTTARLVEYIQTAAVAVANVEVELFGQAKALAHGTDEPYQVDRVLSLVRAERLRQDELWGSQTGDPVERFLILMEEVGEIAEEISIPGPMDTRDPGDYVIERARGVGRHAKKVLEAR